MKQTIKRTSDGSRTTKNPQRMSIKATARERAKERRRYRDEVLRPKWAAKAAAKLEASRG